MGERGPRRRRPPRPAARARPRRRDQRAVRAARSIPTPASRDLPAGMRQRVEIIKCLRRDPDGARLRRADVGAVAGRVRVPVRRPAPGRRGGGQGGRARQPQARRDPARHRRHHDHARRPRGRDARRRQAPTPARSRGRWSAARSRCAASTRSLTGDATADRRRRRRRPASGHRRARSAIATPRVRGHDGRIAARRPVARRARRARSSASPASRATASARSATCCRASSRSTSGTVEVDGAAIATGRAGAMASAGVAVIPEDRHDSGCVLDFTVAENIVHRRPRARRPRGLMDPRRDGAPGRAC